MLQIEVDSKVVQSILINMQDLSAKLTEQVLEDAGAFLLNRIRTRFLAEKAPDDTQWEPSKAALKRRRAGGSGTLFDTGKLFRSIQFGKIGSGEAVIATDVEYAPYLHYGFEHWISGDRVGPWPFLATSQADANVLELVLANRLEDYLRDAQ